MIHFFLSPFSIFHSESHQYTRDTPQSNKCLKMENVKENRFHIISGMYLFIKYFINVKFDLLSCFGYYMLLELPKNQPM